MLSKRLPFIITYSLVIFLIMALGLPMELNFVFAMLVILFSLRNRAGVGFKKLCWNVSALFTMGIVLLRWFMPENDGLSFALMMVATHALLGVVISKSEIAKKRTLHRS